ncbi:MAG: gamma-glutamyltransferase [Wenzhouxiangellaceae bacterium]|nr:gamma-glutamyltransferase [Wenzhouxiangellaceae bacterium]
MKPGIVGTTGCARVASGHAETTRAATEVLRAGGNAVDALIAAGWTACVAEPVFCSPGGGGYALVRPRGRAGLVLDSFAQTPARRRLDGEDFFAISGDFGTDRQEFHIGLGSAAVPGMVAGLFALQRRHARLPMRELMAPAIALTRDGVELNAVQREALCILEPIVRASDGAAQIFGLDDAAAPLPKLGERVANPALAASFEALASEGAGLFYHGELAREMAQQSLDRGGHLRLIDFQRYRAHWHRPLYWQLGRARIGSNPPPAFGGIMVQLMTRALERQLPRAARFGSVAHLEALIEAMHISEQQRRRLERPECLKESGQLMRAFRALDGPVPIVARGTTQISVRDADGNLAGMTLSNGEGCGRAVPGRGFMLNNMLGEEDLNRLGFGRWPCNRRLASMMAPTVIEHAGRRIVLGSGGSNRIRTAIAQVLCNVMHFGMDLNEAVRAPRLHLEGQALSVECSSEAWSEDVFDWLNRHWPEARHWPRRSLFFGGVHAVSDDDQAADPRRLGAACTLDRPGPAG